MMAHIELRMTTLTPLHIGGPEAIGAGQYVRMQGYMYVIDEEKLLHLLQKRGLVDRFLGDAQGMLNSRTDHLLKAWLERYRLWHESVIRDISAYRCKWAAGPKKVGEIRAMTRDPYGQPQVYGTSIKGALRTVVLYQLAKRLRDRDPKGFEALVQQSLEAASHRPNQARKVAGKKLVDRLLANFALGEASRKPGEDSPHKDFLRVLKVGDARPFSPEAASVVTADVLCVRDRGQTYRKAEVVVEAVDAEQVTAVRLALDDWLMERFQQTHRSLPFTRLEQIIDAAAEFHEDWVRDQEEFYRWAGQPVPDDLQKTRGQSILHLGWGSGLSGTTLLMLLPAERRFDIRDRFFRRRPIRLFPKSRRLGPGNLPLGLVRVEVVEPPGGRSRDGV